MLLKFTGKNPLVDLSWFLEPYRVRTVGVDDDADGDLVIELDADTSDDGAIGEFVDGPVPAGDNPRFPEREDSDRALSSLDVIEELDITSSVSSIHQRLRSQ